MPKKVLIVEDEKEILRLIIEVFDGQDDIGILSASDGGEALKIIRRENPDLVLLDIQIPGVNGFDLCKLVKSDSNMSRTKILMLSGMTQKSDSQKAIEVGADGYVTKPFNPDILIKKVRDILTLHSL